MYDLTVVIVSYNTASVTVNCLKSLDKSLQGSYSKVEVVLIDNASSDDSVKKISELKVDNYELHIIENKENVGYGRANNQGFVKAKGRYVLLLNSDVIIDSLDFANLIDYMDKNLRVGGLTVKVNLSKGTIDPASHRGFPTVWRSFCYFFGLEKLFGNVPVLNKLFGGYHLTHLNLDTIHEIDSPTGAFFLIRKTVLDELHGFDEDFFMYGEDLDLAYRMKERALKIIYYPTWHVTHLKYSSGMGSVNQQTRREIRTHFYDAMRIFYKKHYESKNPGVISVLVYQAIEFKKKHI